MTRERRTRIYIPGSDPRRLLFAKNTPADGIVFDLEDSVPQDKKELARQNIAKMLQSNLGAAEVMIRINSLESKHLDEDLKLVGPGLQAIAYPKAESAQEIIRIEELLSARERATGLAPGTIKIIPAIESPLGILNAYSIAKASPRIVAISLGGGDFRKELGVKRSPSGGEVFCAKSLLVINARAAGVQALDTVYPGDDISDAFRQECEECFMLGFDGKGVIHPDQIEPIHQIYAKHRLPKK